MKSTLETILIPGGPFLMGASNETVELPPFRIAKYPVTNADYFEFTEETKYRRPNHWPLHGRFQSDQTKHPVVFVSWEDTKAYTLWLGARLPAESEWEKAARGTDGLHYPWGNEFIASNCNTSESGTDGTRPVDAHPGGISPFDVFDMAGNVWEWTSTLYEAGEEWRVLKGGGWDYKGIKDAICSYRVYFGPSFRNNAVGFRCCWDE